MDTSKKEFHMNPVFQRQRNVANNATVSKVVSFIGDTQSGKSFLISKLLEDSKVRRSTTIFLGFISSYPYKDLV
jgi:hypothetical protein